MRRIDWALLSLLILGAAVFALKLHIVLPIKWIGHADAADYAEMADSLIHGKGLSVEYIGYCYFISQWKYPQITHPDAHYPPLYSFLIVPFFLIFGKKAFAAKIPSLLVSSLGVPCVVYLLTKKLTGSRLVGLAAGLTSLVVPKMFRHSLYCLSDVLYAFTVNLTILLFLKGFERPGWFVPAGVSAALSYLAKGSGLVLMPAYLASYLILRPKKGWGAHDRWFAFGVLAAFLTLLPWFIRNAIHFGNPIFSTQSYAAGYIGYRSWEEGTYSLYLDGKLPNITWKFREGIGKVWRMTKEFYKRYLWWAFMDEGRGWGDLDWGEFRTYYTGLPALVGGVFLLLSCLFEGQRRFFRPIIRRFADRSTPVRLTLERAKPVLDFISAWFSNWFEPKLIAFLIPGFALMTFLAVCWSPIDRLTFPFTLMAIVAGWWTCHRFLTFITPRRLRWIVPFILLAASAPLIRHNSLLIRDMWKAGGYPFTEGGVEWMDVARWLRENAPGAITMTRNPWELHFYTEQKAIQIPRAPLELIVKAMRFYKVTHIIPQLDIRPTLKPLVTGEIPGLELVYDNGKLKLYRIRHDLLDKVFPREGEK